MKRNDARGGVGSGNADSRPSRTMCPGIPRAKGERLVGIDDKPALRFAGGKLCRQASTLATRTTDEALFERS
jgi:hypothetical protein